MFRSLLWKLLVVTVLVLMPYGYADAQFKESPVDPGAEHLMGPAIVGSVEFIDQGDGAVAVTFEGRCGGTPIGPIGKIFYSVNFSGLPGNLENFRLQGGVGQFKECYPSLVGGDLIIQAVTRFSRTSETTATAQLVLLAVVRF